MFKFNLGDRVQVDAPSSGRCPAFKYVGVIEARTEWRNCQPRYTVFSDDGTKALDFIEDFLTLIEGGKNGQE